MSRPRTCRGAAAAVLLAAAAFLPATSLAIPSITASPTSASPGAVGVAVDLFFNVFPGDTVTAGTAQIVAPGTTLFTNSVPVSVGGAATVGGVNNDGTVGAADAGYVFGPNVTPVLASGAYQFATLTITAGGPGDSLTLIAGSYVQAPFCNGTVSNEGATLVEIVPEPSVALLLGAALAGMAMLRRRSA